MRKNLSKSEIKDLNQKLKELYGLEEFFDKKAVVILSDDKIIIENDVMFFTREDKLIPTLKQLLKNNFLKKIAVDMGAVPFIIKGADIMRKGIKEIADNIKEGEIVAVIDEKHHKPLAVGIALFNSEGIKLQTEGKSVKNIHCVGDELWKNSSSGGIPK
ncbi:DUF1947 domain-containing protein [Candidatus Woesearchaeota archaeon]|nr:DUF1947 domain-containing protein [Candidatus Woesearchaeota archaeon]